jgi:predicted ATP-grasp superfamily ATP-dependent carboligase
VGPGQRSRRVIVTDSEQRAALAVVRSLGRAGHEVMAVGHKATALAKSSRYALAHEMVANPFTEPAQFTNDIALLVGRWRADVVLPVAEQSHLALLPQRERLAPAIVAAGSYDAFRHVSDKDLVLATAARLGIHVPRQVLVPDRDAARRSEDDAALAFPVVLKPARSVVGGNHFSVLHARDLAEYRERLASLPDHAFPLLVQQRIVGRGQGVFLLVWGGELVASFAHRRLREMPPSGGASVLSESIPADPELVRLSRALLDELGWDGVAMVEYKVETATGRAFIMEINGRFWGTTQLAIDAGVDFPALLVAAALGDTLPAAPAYRDGVRLRQWWGDVDHLITRLRHSPTKLSLPADAPSNRRVLGEFLRWRSNSSLDAFRLDDPRPFLRDTATWLRGRLLRGDA